MNEEDYVTEAMSLLQGEPAAIIEQPRARTVLRAGMGEEWTVAWVKLSTAFKPHIKEIRGAPLAVWLYIALSVNKQGVSFPSINKIAEDTGYSRNGVMDAIKELEERGYMKVRRGERKFNLYEPEFAAIGRTNEPSNESTQFTSPVLPPDESTFSPDESSVLDLNKSNKNKPDLLDMLLEQEQKAQPIRNACLMFETAMLGSTVSQWPWDSNAKWQKFAKWVTTQEPSQFTAYADWRKKDGKYQAMSNNKIRQDPQMFMDTGWPTFLAHTSMYGENTSKAFPL
jgi:biotin operon repressor